MRILITGSSGQIGTNLGLYLQERGHYVFGVDKRPNTWTRDIETLLQDLSAPYRNHKCCHPFCRSCQSPRIGTAAAPSAGKHQHDFQRVGVLSPERYSHYF